VLGLIIEGSYHAVCHVLLTCRQCNIDVRQRLANNIVFAGGSTQFVGFKSRFVSELFSLLETDSRYEELKPLKSKVNILSPVFPANIIQWTGATLFAVQEPKHYTVTRKCYIEKKMLPDWTRIQSQEEKQRLKRDSPIKQIKSKPRIATGEVALKMTLM